MMRIGLDVIWQKNAKTYRGQVVDFYRFKSEMYAKEYNHAVLVKRPNGKHILKLEKELKTLED